MKPAVMGIICRFMAEEIPVRSGTEEGLIALPLLFTDGKGNGTIRMC